jgi:hypothetical protein
VVAAAVDLSRRVRVAVHGRILVRIWRARIGASWRVGGRRGRETIGRLWRLVHRRTRQVRAVGHAIMRCRARAGRAGRSKREIRAFCVRIAGVEVAALLFDWAGVSIQRMLRVERLCVRRGEGRMVAREMRRCRSSRMRGGSRRHVAHTAIVRLCRCLAAVTTTVGRRTGKVVIAADRDLSMRSQTGVGGGTYRFLAARPVRPGRCWRTMFVQDFP